MPSISKPFAVLMLFAVAASGCASRNQVASNSGVEDDDAFCRANGVVAGSPEYIACRRDRDVQRSNAVTQADKRQRNLGEYMLNNPTRP